MLLAKIFMSEFDIVLKEGVRFMFFLKVEVSFQQSRNTFLSEMIFCQVIWFFG